MAIQNEYIDPHEQNTDTKLDESGVNEVTASEIVKNIYNVILLAFKLAIQDSLTYFNLLDGIVDEYEDESGIDTVNSTGETYDSTDDYYKPTPGTPIDTSPYTHFKCNDDAGNTTVTDNGTGANNGTASTNTSNLSVSGKINDAFEFNGSDEYINIDNVCTDIHTNTTGTFSFWFQVPSLTTYYTLFALGDENASNIFDIEWEGTIQQLWVGIGMDGSTVAQYWTAGVTWSINTWYHVVIVQDGASVTMYRDGQSVSVSGSNKSYWINNANGSNLDVGRLGVKRYNGNNSQWFAGKIDDFRYYQSKVLTSDDVALLYNSGNGTEDDTPSGSPENMVLLSNAFTAESEPSQGRIVIFEENVDSITLNTDLKAYISRDNGSTWGEGTLSKEGNYDATKQVLTALVDLSLSGIGSGTNMKYKITTLNNKNLKIHGTGLNWD